MSASAADLLREISGQHAFLVHAPALIAVVEAAEAVLLNDRALLNEIALWNMSGLELSMLDLREQLKGTGE